jgi:hypothetical protein
MIQDMTNLSLFHNACRGLHAPRDKYIFDRSVAEGYLSIELTDNFKPIYSFTQFSGEIEPAPSNVHDVLRSLKFYSRDSFYTSLSHKSFEISYKTERTLQDITLEEVQDGLTFNYTDLCDRKGSLYFKSQYVKALLNSSEKITQYLQNGGELYLG